MVHRDSEMIHIASNGFNVITHILCAIVTARFCNRKSNRQKDLEFIMVNMSIG